MRWYVTSVETVTRRKIYKSVDAATERHARWMVKMEQVEPDEVDTLQYDLEVEVAEKVKS